MRIRFHVDTKQVEEMIAKAPDRVRLGIIRGLSRSAEVVVKEIQTMQKALGRNFTGTLLSAWPAGIVVDRTTLTATISPALARKRSARGKVDYGHFAEHGRGPGGWPPRGVLREWLRRRLAVAEEDLDKAEFFLRRSIGARGTRVKPFVAPALRTVDPRVHQLFEQEMDRVAAELDEEGSV